MCQRREHNPAADREPVCGARTADILVHEIRAVNAPHARDLGFEDVETLVDADDGTGYRLVECGER